MKLNVRAIALAQGAVAGLLFVLCRLIFMLAPDASLASMKYFFHTDWTSVAVPVNWGGFFLGLVLLTLFAALVGAVWSSIYNWLTPESIVGSKRVAVTGPTSLAA